jgi:hypothetical protein
VHDEWARLTRFLESARVAFGREQQLWTTLGIQNAAQVEIAAPASQGKKYRVELRQHIEALAEPEMLYASVLVHSYALAETAAAEKLGVSVRALSAIEDWGTRLLTAAGKDWSAVKGGLRGAVEVAVVRNALAHGMRAMDAPAAKRLAAAGLTNRPEGSAVSLSYQDLYVFRDRLLRLLKAGRV